MLPVVILAGGLATRLKNISNKIPKSLIKIYDKPFIYFQLKLLSRQGFNHVIICLGHKGYLIKKYLLDNNNLNLNIDFSYDGRKALGTGGAIRNALPKLQNDFFVLYGDSYLEINFKKVMNKYFKENKSALMTIIKNNNNWDKSNIYYKNKQIIQYNKNTTCNKMQYIDYGLSIMSKEIFLKYKKNTNFDLSDIFFQLSLNKQLASYVTKKRFYEIGSIKGLKETRDYLNSKFKMN